MRFLLAPLNPQLGAIAANAGALRAARALAASEGAALLVTPEASLSGAPPADIAARPELLAACEAALQSLAAETADGGPGLLLGAPWREAGRLHSGILLLEGGRIVARRARHAFPHGPEPRLSPGPAPGPMAFRGLRLGVMSGADAEDPAIAETLGETGADLLLSLTATPFTGEPEDRASDAAVARVVETGLPFLGLNLQGGQGPWVHPGGGFVLNADRRLAARLPAFDPAPLLVEWQEGEEGWRCPPLALPVVMPPQERLWRALVLALGDAVAKGGFAGVMVDPAGGAAAALLAEAARAAGLRLFPVEEGPAVEARAAACGALLLNAATAEIRALGEGSHAGHLAPFAELWPGELTALAAARGLPTMPAESATTAILRGLLEEKPVDALAAQGYDPAEVFRLWGALAAAAYRRRQAPAALRLGRGLGDPFSNGMTGLLP
ncbi:nitrilase-related carbon-nitrogen hydrolase [Roseomonas sp. E05]|uniref:nitrilase-related carbon-nitrogen hydrolase n=1 Tax=Roseomonas sp. E05 TaxID=3046310 RepID=UPI0024B90C09|nr:nitrilase-related carbon-nitrogen hydrolase [Roseomonas sp. E05]MDJ0388252.1 nitrilase-related carbon-nitrogen hydrolase [Roseomonas sp. E05]